jgi:hypothetical protein
MAALAATDWRTREQHLAKAYEAVGDLHNQLDLTDTVDPTTRPYHDRPFRVLRAERFAGALVSRIPNRALRELPLTGAVDQFVDSTDVLERPEIARATHEAATKPTAR